MPKSKRSEERREVMLSSVRTQEQMKRTEEAKPRFGCQEKRSFEVTFSDGTLFLRYLVSRPSAFPV